ncbi:MAG: SCO family protein [Steroidobacteraceae bacterium]
MMRPACIAACLAIAAVCAQPGTTYAVEAALPDDSVYQLDAMLVDQFARPLRFRDLRGKPRLVTMIYTQCKYVCPMIVDSVQAVERGLTPAERLRIGFVLISMDPKRDTPAALQAVMTTRRLNPAAWTLLRPEETGLRGIAGILGVRYRALADGEFNHTTELVLLDADGRILARSAQIGGGVDRGLLAAVRAVLAP